MRKSLQLFVLLLINHHVNAQSPTFQWAKNMGGISSATYAKAMTTDIVGNVYTSGYFIGTVDFDPGPGIFNLSTVVTDVAGDIFITKCNSSGSLIWAKQMGGASLDYASSIAVDPAGNVFIGGSFKGTADFDPGAGVFNLSASSSYNDIFVSKLNASGNFVWAQKFGSTLSEEVYSIALDAAGNIFTAGSLYQQSNQNQIYLNKLDPSGNLLWSKIYGGTSYDQANAIATDVSGNIYITGNFIGVCDFDPGVGIYNMTAPGSTYDVFISKIDGSGNFIWAKQFGGTGADQGVAIDLDASGNVFVAGKFSLTVDFDPGQGTFNLTSAGSADNFITKLDNSGNFIWAKHFGNTQGDEIRSIIVDNSGYVYSTGYFTGTLDFDPGAGTFNLTAVNVDIFISKLDVFGNFLWAQIFGNISSERVFSITLDGSDNIYTCGTFYGTVDFDPGPGISNLTAQGAPDLFMHKLIQCVPPSTTITPTGLTTFCFGGSVTLNAPVGAGLTYQWKKNNVSISGATSSSYIATATGLYTCYLSNPCGAVTSNSIQVTVNTIVPGTPGSIATTGGVVKVCPGETRTYTVNAVTGVTSYTWTPCAGSAIIAGQNTNSVIVQYNAGFPASDTLRVVANNSCGSSTQRKLKISRNTPGTPSSITGDNYSVCNLSGKPYSVTNVSGITYGWSFNTGTATVATGQGTSSITANYGIGFLTGTLSVTATNGCGTSAARAKSIYAKPATPVSITGPTGVCLNQQDVPYSILPLANIINYTWSGPSGSHISDGVTTSAGTTLVTTATAINVDFGTAAGSLRVRGNNACASGSYRTLAISFVCRQGDFSNDNIKIQLFPNPATTEFEVLTNEISSPFDMEVFDAYGRLVFSEVNLNPGYTVNTGGWANGIYTVIVFNSSNQYAMKLVLHN